MSGLKLKLKNKMLQESSESFSDPTEKSTSSVSRSGVLKFSNDRAQVNAEPDNHKSQEPAPKEVKLKYSKREEKKKKSNKYFYRVSNHHELFKIGRSFYSDYLSGVKSFAITSTGYQTSQQKSILGLASFFDHKEDIKIGIVSDNLDSGAFKDIMSISKKVNIDLFGLGNNITIYSFFNHFEFINMDDLLKIANNDSLVGHEEVFDQIVDMYDVIFWDVPELHKIQINAESYFPLIMKFESISIIVAQALSKRSDIDEIKRFFLGYGINLKGLLLADHKVDERAKVPEVKNTDKKPINKKHWWQIKLFK